MRRWHDFLVVATFAATVTVSANATGPPIARPVEPTPAPSAMATATPRPTSTSTASPSPTITQTPTRTPSIGAESNARVVVQRCMAYVPLLYDMAADETVGYLARQPDLALAIAAKETFCDHTVDEGANGVGLMAVVPQPWTTTRERLLVPRINVWFGLWILDRALLNEEHNPAHDLRTALAAYNCGWKVLEGDNCGWYGGFVYADDVLGFWLPRIRATLDDYTGRDFVSANRVSEQGWLRSLGFGLPTPEPVLH